MASEPQGPRPAFCEQPETHRRATAIDALFCAETGAPSIASLRELQRALQLVPFAELAGKGGLTHRNEVVLLGHSTALPGHLVSPINPRAIILGQESMLAYVRGAQEVELVSRARDGSDKLVFYLLRYEQACNRDDAGCSNADLYTPATESGWTKLELRDGSELENTPFDCRICHARATDRASLLMREIDGPWTHFFDTRPAGAEDGGRPEVKGYDLLHDYLEAKGDERYADIDVSRYAPAAAQALEIAATLDQPLYFDSLAIERERWPYRAEGFAADPLPSPTWEAGYAAWKRGEQLALPHFDPRPTSKEKQARLTGAYVRFRAGELDATELPDLADIFPDDPLTRAQIGLETEPDATPAEALIQACGTCHNAVLNQEISRARFSIDLTRMTEAEIATAIERVELPRTAAGAMPPQRARALTPRVRERLIKYLRTQMRADTVDPQLVHAAEMGMLGGSRPSRR